jgi:hypothetical protein
MGIVLMVVDVRILKQSRQKCTSSFDNKRFFLIRLVQIQKSTQLKSAAFFDEG